MSKLLFLILSSFYQIADYKIDLGKWIFQEIKNTLPKSQIGKAMAYA